MSDQGDSKQVKEALKQRLADVIKGDAEPARPLDQAAAQPQEKTDESDPRGKVTFDDKGNAVWKFQVPEESADIGDETIDLLDTREVKALSLDEEGPWTEKSGSGAARSIGTAVPDGRDGGVQCPVCQI